MAITNRSTSRALLASLRFRNWRISVKLIVATLIAALIPVLVATFIGAQNTASILSTQVYANLQTMATSAARVLRDGYSSHYDMLLSFATDENVIAFLQNPDDEDNLAAAEQVWLSIYGYSSTEALAIYDTSGITLLDEGSAEEEWDKSDTPKVKAALAGQVYVSVPYFQPNGIFPSIDFALPVRSDSERTPDGIPDGAIIGAVSLTMSVSYLDFLNRDTLLVLEGSSQANTRALYVVDAAGLVVAHSTEKSDWLYRGLGTVRAEGPLGAACPESSPDWQGCEESVRIPRTPGELPALAPVADAILPALKAGTSGTFRYCLPNDPNTLPAEGCDPARGVWHLISYAPVTLQTPPSNPLMVVADIPESVITELVNEQRRNGLLIAALVGPLVVVFSLLIARTIARPIDRLAAVAREIEAQKPLDPAALEGVSARDDEIGNLSRVFAAMVQASRARMEELRIIYEIGSQISDSVVMHDTLEYIAISLRRAIPYDWMEICLYNPLTQQMVVRVAADTDSVEEVSVSPYPIDSGTVGWLMRTREALLISDMTTFPGIEGEPGRSWDKLRPRSYLGVPLLHKGAVIGTLEMICSSANGFDEANRRVLQSVAIQAAIAVQNAQEVAAREIKLRQEIQELKVVIDEARKAREVQAITETSYFQDLQQRVGALRKRVKGESSSEG